MSATDWAWSQMFGSGASPTSTARTSANGSIRNLRCARWYDVEIWRVARGPRKRVFDLPAGQPRLTVEPVGVHGVWVNGVAHGSAGARWPGRLLREFSA